jgi:ribonuclease-3
MRIVRPGSIGSSEKKKRESTSRENQRDSRESRDRQPEERRELPFEVWDDYLPYKPVPKKKEFQKGTGNRMIPKQGVVSKSTKSKPKSEREIEESTSYQDGPRYEPRVDFENLEEAFGYQFQDRSLLIRSLTHRSALGFKERADYERLEFLGDAVLDLSVAHLLSDLHPEAREGELSKMRAALVNTQALAVIAKELNVSPFVKLGRGELSAGGAERPSILADVMEAIIGAVYRDSNYETALKLVERMFGSALKEVTPFDPKTELQEVLHAAGSEPPTYLLELVEGPEHAPTFVTVVYVDGQIVGRGRGSTKKAAQQEAAALALRRMMYDGKPLSLKEGQRFFIESGLLLPSEADKKRRPLLEQDKG